MGTKIEIFRDNLYIVVLREDGFISDGSETRRTDSEFFGNGCESDTR